MPEPIAGGFLKVANVPSSNKFELDWDQLTPTAQFLVIGLFTQNKSPGQLEFDLGGIARDVGNLVGDIVG